MTKPTKVILACDESGAKGYGDLDETEPGEVGVFAGVLVPDSEMNAASLEFQKIYDCYKPSVGKLHIADLADQQKEALRCNVYDAIRKFGLPCFWYAIHVAGLHAHNEHSQKVVRDAQEELRKSNNGRGPLVKQGSPRSDPLSMHVELFAGLYAYVIAYLEERDQRAVDLEVRMDQVDQPIVKQFEAVAGELLSKDPVTLTGTGFHTVTKQIVEGTITVELQMPAELQIKLIVRSLTLNSTNAADGLILAADVLANSLNHLFRSRTDNDRYSDLNTPSAVASHPLAPHLDAFRETEAVDLIGDRIYRHPRASQS